MDKKNWWKEAVVYQIYPRSFQDTNGDGIGDIKGILNRLDYLEALGVTVLWLCPVYRSPMDDGGYDIADYEQIDPMFGTNEDMETLIREAEKRGMKILMDLVVNHTSDEHEWFQKALADPEGPYADYYIFRKGINESPPNNWRTYFGGSAWAKVEGSEYYYLHAFGKKQPDLNWENPKLREEIYQMVNRWLDKGLGGFRVDAICNLKKNLQTGTFPADGEDGLCYIGDWITNQPGLEEYLSELRDRTFRPHNSMTVAEANVPDELLKQFIGEDGFFSMVFDFSYTDIDVPDTGEWFRPTAWTTAELRDRIFHSQEQTQKIGWGAVYLENHDQPRSLNKYLPEEDIHYYSITMLAALFMMLRGTPFIYQGQEIGMTNIAMQSVEAYDDLATHDQYRRAILAGLTEREAMDIVNKRSRDNSRTPMQWSRDNYAGFTTGPKPWFPVNPNYQEIHVEKQSGDPQSVLSFYKALIALRRSGPYKELIIDGMFRAYAVSDPNVIAYKRCYQGREMLVICNFQNRCTQISLDKQPKAKVLHNYAVLEMANCKCSLRPYECILLEC